MTRHAVPVRPIVRLALAVAWGASFLSGTGPARAQSLDLPVPDLEVSPGNEVVTLSWPEVATTAGRAVGNVRYNDWDFTSSSELTFVGEYALDCDYRLRLSKIPRDAGLGRWVQIVYQIFENTGGVGAPRDADTLDVFEPDTEYLFETSIAGDVGLRFTSTLQEAPGPMGTVGVTVGGLCTSNTRITGYYATPLNSVSQLADTLMIRVAGPVNLDSIIPDPLPPTIPRDTLMVTAAGQTFPVMNGMNLTFSDGAASPADTAKWRAHYLFPPQGTVSADLNAFEGYHIWRADIPRRPGGEVGEDGLSPLALLGEIRQCESKFTFHLLDEEKADLTQITLVYDPIGRSFALADSSVHNDFPYEYGLSTFDRGFLGNVQNVTFEGEVSRSGKLYPARAQRVAGSKVYVVPNPYKESSDWEEGERKIVFSNLPSSAIIRIFSAAADHLVTLEHGPGVPQSTSATSRSWNLKTARGQTVVPGIYIYQVEGTGSAEAFRQVDKFIVAR
jgi:hypothetical protein